METGQSRLPTTQEQIERVTEHFFKELHRRLKQHGDGSFISLHEILGALNEEYDEAREAVRANQPLVVAAELYDIMVAAFWGIVSIDTAIQAGWYPGYLRRTLSEDENETCEPTTQVPLSAVLDKKLKEAAPQNWPEIMEAQERLGKATTRVYEFLDAHGAELDWSEINVHVANDLVHRLFGSSVCPVLFERVVSIVGAQRSRFAKMEPPSGKVLSENEKAPRAYIGSTGTAKVSEDDELTTEQLQMRMPKEISLRNALSRSTKSVTDADGLHWEYEHRPGNLIGYRWYRK